MTRSQGGEFSSSLDPHRGRASDRIIRRMNVRKPLWCRTELDRSADPAAIEGSAQLTALPKARWSPARKPGSKYWRKKEKLQGSRRGK